MSQTTLMKLTSIDDYPVVPTEEDETLGPSITSLRNNEFHFFKKSQKTSEEFVQKCQSFATLIKTSPFQKGSKKPTPQNFKLACSEAVICDISTSSSLKKVEASPIQGAAVVQKRRVSFSEEYKGPMGSKSKAGGILKLRNTRRYSQDQSDLYVIRPRAGSFDISKQQDNDAENSELEVNQSFDVGSHRESRQSKPRGAKRNSHGQSPKRNGSQSPNKGENSKSRFYRGSVQALGK